VTLSLSYPNLKDIREMRIRKRKLELLAMLRKFQNWHHPKNHEYDGEIDESWDNYFSGTALSLIASRTVRLSAHDEAWSSSFLGGFSIFPHVGSIGD